MRIILTAVNERRLIVDYLCRHIPGLEIVWDRGLGLMDTMMRAWSLTGEDAALRLQDDIILTRDFMPKVMAVIEAHPKDPINFFSMRQADLDVGSRWEPGRTWLMNQCHYLPRGMSRMFFEYVKAQPHVLDDYPTGDDSIMALALKDARQRYLLSVPSLVDHPPIKSAVNPRRPRRRMSKTFADPEMEGFPIITAQGEIAQKEGRPKAPQFHGEET